MKIFDHTITEAPPDYPIHHIAPLEQILFLDIETTGFTAKNSVLYLIGVTYYQESFWKIRQWFAETYEEELSLLHAFFEFAASYSHLIHFNGNNFDLPYLLQKCRQYRLPYHFDTFEGIDLYRRTAPYKSMLRLPNCKLKTLEVFLGLSRKDLYGGGELISIYHSYAAQPQDHLLHALILHNKDDMAGMLYVLPILAYHNLFHEPVTAKKVQANYYINEQGTQCQELMIKLSLHSSLPHPLSLHSNECYFKGEGKEGLLRIPLYTEELKYFYSNYKNYYYLPEEDTAIHKSVASFVDKKHRTQAMAATCYTKKYATFLPQWKTLFEPFFKKEYHSRELFFELTEDLKKDRNAFSSYAAHVLQMIISS